MEINGSEKIVEATVLGTGKGATALIYGEPSSSIVIKVDGECRLLVDVGLGVSHRYFQLCEMQLPSAIFVSHNHSDHSGELPPLAIVAASMGARIHVISGPEVAERLKRHRMHEALSAGFDIENLVKWVMAEEEKKVEIDADLSLIAHRGKHSEISYGFVLYFDDHPILGFSGDSGFDRDFYEKLAAAPVLFFDARAKGSPEHASFEDVAKFQKEKSDRRIFVHGYGRAHEAPEGGKPQALRVEEVIRIHPPKR